MCCSRVSRRAAKKEPKTVVARLLDAPHRALFLFAALCALGGPAVWLLPDHFVSPATTHAHALLLGMGTAAAGGYILTALNSWSRKSAHGTAVNVAAAGLWLLTQVPPLTGIGWIEAVSRASYCGFLAVYVSWRLLRAANFKRLWVTVPLYLLEYFQAARALHESDGSPLAPPLTVPLIYAVLIIAVGGRAVTAFVQSHRGEKCPQAIRLASVASGVSCALIGAAQLMSNLVPAVCAPLMIVAGLCTLALGLTWLRSPVLGYPALAMMCLSWFWVPLGLTLTGLSQIYDCVPSSAALHALTAGAMGTMIFAIMSRAAMRRRGGRLLVGRLFGCGYVFVWGAAFGRSVLPLFMPPSESIIQGGVLLWTVGWCLFLTAYIAAFGAPSPRPVFSASSS